MLMFVFGIVLLWRHTLENNTNEEQSRGLEQRIFLWLNLVDCPSSVFGYVTAQCVAQDGDDSGYCYINIGLQDHQHQLRSWSRKRLGEKHRRLISNKGIQTGPFSAGRQGAGYY